jgi:hypothetical protein
MSLLLLNVLLVLVGPFLLVAPMAMIAARNLAPASQCRRSRLRVSFSRTGVAW